MSLPLLAALSLAAALAAQPASSTAAQVKLAATNPAPGAYLQRLPQDETVYFLLPDRFANGDPSNDRGHVQGGPMQTGYDPTKPNFYLGGDLKGLIGRLDYIQRLGATAIWVAPVFTNKWVQGSGAHASAGYHGYWITDFTDVDPHFGTLADFKALVDAAHARGMKVYMDIVVNHTADVIQYRECPQSFDCPFRNEADYPWTRRGGVNGAPINTGFQGIDAEHQTAENFARLTRPDYAYTPYLPAGTEHLKKPDWLNDIHLYHNRGNFNSTREATLEGDFSGLDDVMTENPRVVAGFIKVFEDWVADFHIDGYRIDTARHVDPQFWQAFSPALLDFAHAHGIPNFHMFGEVYDARPAILARHTRVDRLPAVLDFGFQDAALKAIGGGASGTDVLEQLFFADPDYQDGAAGAMRLPIFLDNHDMGRFAYMLNAAHPKMGRDELTRRVILGHALMAFSRGFPVIYAGDEQGFVGSGGDSASRQPLFASKVPAFRAERPLGETHAGGDHYDETNPIYHAIAQMLAIRNAHPGLRRGVQQVRLAESAPGLYAFTRTSPDDGQYLIVINTALTPRSAHVQVDADRLRWTALHGACAPQAAAPGSLAVTLAPLDYLVCRAGG